MDDLRYGYTSPRSPGALTTILVRDATGTVVRTYEDEAFNDSAPGQYVLSAVEAPLYGSARVGSERTRIRVRSTRVGSLNPPPGRRRGGTVYELSNHLGNVLATVSDIAAVESVADAAVGMGDAATRAARVTTASDYYPFGLSVEGRTYEPVVGGSAYADVIVEYRYGFNGKEHDLSWGGLGIQDYGCRLYVPGTGRFLSVDPLTASYPWYTPYQFAGNKPIIAIDLDGGEEKITVHYQEACCTGAEGLFRTVKTETQIASQMSFTGEHRKAAVHAWFTSGTTSEQNRRANSHMHVYVVAGDKPGEYNIREAIYKDYPMLEKYRDGGYGSENPNESMVPAAGAGLQNRLRGVQYGAAAAVMKYSGFGHFGRALYNTMDGEDPWTGIKGSSNRLIVEGTANIVSMGFGGTGSALGNIVLNVAQEALETANPSQLSEIGLSREAIRVDRVQPTDYQQC